MVQGRNYKDSWSPLTSSEEYTDVNLNCLFNVIIYSSSYAFE